MRKGWDFYSLRILYVVDRSRVLGEVGRGGDYMFWNSK